MIDEDLGNCKVFSRILLHILVEEQKFECSETSGNFIQGNKSWSYSYNTLCATIRGEDYADHVFKRKGNGQAMNSVEHSCYCPKFTQAHYFLLQTLK